MTEPSRPDGADPAPGEWIRPEPMDTAGQAQVVGRRDQAGRVAESLCAGQWACVGDLYSTGLAILAEIRRFLQAGGQAGGQSGSPPADYAGSRQYRAAYRAASQRLLGPVEDNRIALGKAPSVGWLAELYPEVTDFYLPFPQLQGLNSSWQWYERGIHLPPLGHRLYPFYGTYFPTRFDHLELFDTWLRGYGGSRELAYDIGTGCGVLALQLGQAGFGRVVATDVNPNAIESVRRELGRRTPTPAIEPGVGDLFGAHEEAADLVVFNPPWLPGVAHGPLDQAVYYEEDLFARFFAGASAHMRLEARLVLLFSTLLRDHSTEAVHPIEAELASGRRFELVQRLQQRVRASSAKTRRRKRSPERERVEMWELRCRGSAGQAVT